jgi:hypothetical protein
MLFLPSTPPSCRCYRAFGQVGINQKPYRLFGGAPIITSREATRQLAPKLEQALEDYQSRGDSTKYHDMAFTE